MTDGPWDGWHNAEVYDRFVRERSIYAQLNRVLVDLAQVETGRRVLDLGCGPGATATAALARLPRDATLVGTDASADMVAVASANNLDPRASFHACPAEHVLDGVEGPFDRVLCNAALWQFPDPAGVIASVGQLLDRADGVFTFNVPADRMSGHQAIGQPLQVTLARAVEAVGGDLYRTEAERLDPDDLDRWMVRAGMEPAQRVDHTLDTTRAELLELLAIPAIGGPMMHGLDPDLHDEVLREVRDAGEPDERIRVPWVYFVARVSARTSR